MTNETNKKGHEKVDSFAEVQGDRVPAWGLSAFHLWGVFGGVREMCSWPCGDWDKTLLLSSGLWAHSCGEMSPGA